jgi:hypothetical protein
MLQVWQYGVNAHRTLVVDPSVATAAASHEADADADLEEQPIGSDGEYWTSC